MFHDLKMKSKNNSITQTYYTNCLLSVYMNVIDECRVFYDKKFFFQKDNDFSHDTRSAENVVRKCEAIN